MTLLKNPHCTAQDIKTWMSVSLWQFHLSFFFPKYLSYHLSNCSRKRFCIVIVSESFDLAQGASPFCLDSQVLLLFYTLFLAAEKDLVRVGSHSAVSFALRIFCSTGLQDHRYITMRSFRSIASSCHTEPGFPHTLFNTHNTTGSAHYKVLTHWETDITKLQSATKLDKELGIAHQLIIYILEHTQFSLFTLCSSLWS